MTRPDDRSSPRDPRRLARARGFTLVELLVVLLVMAAVAGMAVTLVGGQGAEASVQATRVSLVRIREAILGSSATAGYAADEPANRLPPTLRALFEKPAAAQDFDPVAKTGWRGPYLRHQGATYALDPARGFTGDYGAAGDPAVNDAWGNPIVLQRPNDQDQDARLVSAGPNGVLDTTLGNLTASDRADDLVLFLKRADTP